MKTIFVEFPDLLHQRVGAFVRAGWAPDAQRAVIEAMRRFLDAHEPELVESQALADVEWGLRGKESNGKENLH